MSFSLLGSSTRRDRGGHDVTRAVLEEGVAGENFVGREREVALLLEGLAGLASGRGSLFCLTGEPGIGKTRLADELAGHATRAGAAVAWGAAWDGGGAPAYWPWIEVVRALRPLVPAPDERLRRDLGPLWDDAPADPGDGDPHDPELLGFRRFDALRAVLQAAAQRTRLVVILEDLHAADRASLLALQLVARALRSLPVLILTTHRGAEGARDPALGELLARIAREGTTLPLARLGRPEVAAVMADLPAASGPTVDEVYEACGGNPLFLAESLRLLRRDGRLQGVPAGVSALIGERLAQFEVATREALETAALLGRELTVPVLADACATGAEELRARLRRPLAAGILEETEDGRVRFAHGLYRERLLADLSLERRTALHLRLAGALERWRAAGHLEAEEPLALHLLAAGPAGDPAAAVEWALRAAARARAALAFDRAVALYEGARAALAHLPSEVVRERLIDLELDLAAALVEVGAGPRSRALCLAAADRARALGDGVRLARAALVYGAELRIGLVDGALVGLLAEALQALPGDASRLRARVLARLAAAQQPAPDPQVPVRQAREAIALARQSGDAETLLDTLYSAGSALVDYASAEERLPLSRELLALALPRGELTIGQRAYARLAIDCLELGALAEADGAIAAHERLGQALGHARWRWRSALLRSMQALLAGRWAEAEGAQAEAERLIADADDAAGATTLLIHRIGALRGRERGGPSLLAMLDDPSLGRVEYTATLMPYVRAAVLARMGALADAHRILDSLPPGAGRLSADPAALSFICDAVALVGDADRAAQLLPLLVPFEGWNVSQGLFGMVWEGPVAQLEGGLLLALGQWDEAIAALEEAQAVVAGLGARPFAARIGGQLATALLRRGRTSDHARAQALLERAREEASTLGMEHLVARLAAVAIPALPPEGHAGGVPTEHPPTTAMASGPATASAPAPASSTESRPATVTASSTESRPAPAPASSTESRPATVTATAPSMVTARAADPGTVVLAREGEVWRVAWGGQETRLKHARGLEILAQLVENPDRPFHVLTLGAADPGEVIDTGDAGELLDEEARQAYRRRIAELGQEIEESAAWSDSARRDRLRAEREFLQDELSRAVGRGGRARRAGAAVERARSNVQKRLRAVIRKLAETTPALAHHLDSAIKTGVHVVYRRSPGA
jgi:hypothetical protein